MAEAGLEQLLVELDGRMARRTSTGKPDEATEQADRALVLKLSGSISAALDAPPLSVDPALLVRSFHCLACLAALSSSTSRYAVQKANVVALAMRAATPAQPEDLALPVRVQHLALMLLVNLAICAEGAIAIGEPLRGQLETW